MLPASRLFEVGDFVRLKKGPINRHVFSGKHYEWIFVVLEIEISPGNELYMKVAPQMTLIPFLSSWWEVYRFELVEC